MGSSLPKKRNNSIERQYAAAKKRVLKIGFIAEGSLSKNYVTCGKPTCRCRNDTTHRHGPYYQLTWKRNAKTVSQAIPESLALQYEEWIGNRQALAKIMRKMYAISRKAIDKQLALKIDLAEKSTILSVKLKLRKT
jgi:predicted transcriptional regulator